MIKAGISATVLFLSLPAIVFMGVTEAMGGCCSDNSVGDAPSDSPRVRKRNKSIHRVSAEETRVDISYLKGLGTEAVRAIRTDLKKLSESKRASVKKTYKFFFGNQPTVSSINIWTIVGQLIDLPEKHLNRLPSLYYKITSIETNNNDKIRINLNTSQRWSVATALIQVSPKKHRAFLKEVMTRKRIEYLSKKSKKAFVNYLVKKVKRNVDGRYLALEFKEK